jgi:orotate phosphoribosyltransferase-like protein
MTNTEKLYSSIAICNEAIFRLQDQGLNHKEIAENLRIDVQVVTISWVMT